MRRLVGNVICVRAGELVRVHCKLRSGSDQARLGVWSATGDVGPSPHVQAAAATALSDGKPIMLQPMFVRLDANGQRSHKFEFIADEEMKIGVLEEVDLATDPISAKVGITAHGKAYQNILRRLRNFVRRVGRRTAPRHSR